jgi:energy-coupling factor transporter ATP-binding protein EcfA2
MTKNYYVYYNIKLVKKEVWIPGLMAAKKEVWIQVYGIPLHIWGDNLFKLIGNNIGVFVDFDDETARMARFDMARIKIQTDIWASIDTTIKVEVEGVCFNLWLVEERGKNGSMVTLTGEEEVEVSQVASAAVAGAVDVVADGNDDNSGEDEASGDEGEGDVWEAKQQGERHEVSCVRNVGGELLKEGDLVLTYVKSTNQVNLEIVIPSVTPGEAEKVELAKCQAKKEIILDLSTSQEERDCLEEGGVRGGVNSNFVNEERDKGGPMCVTEQSNGEMGRTKSLADGPDSGDLDQQFVGRLVEETVCRYSSVSEPEEVLDSHRSKVTKNAKHRRQNPGTVFNPIGVPKCLKLVEALKEGGVKSKKKKRRQKEEGFQENEIEVIEGGDFNDKHEEGEKRRRSHVITDCRQNIGVGSVTGGSIPASGINLISGSETSLEVVAETPLQGSDKENVLQAAKLLNLQKEVGFNFEEPDEQIVQQLVEQEICDVAKKMEWEKRKCD